MKEGQFSPKVLCADDDSGHRRLMQIILRRMGWTSCIASDGPEAVRIAGQESPDLILLDLRMPGMDGFQTARRLRQQGVTVPLIAITALEYPDLAADCRSAGYNGWMIKPISPQSLEQVLETWLAAGSKG